VVEADIRSSGIGLSEIEYIALLNSFTKLGCVSLSFTARTCSFALAAPHSRRRHAGHYFAA